MKLLKPFFYAVLFVMTFTACSSDDDNGPATLDLTNANLAGTWSVNFLEGTAVVTEDVGGTEVESSRVETVGDTFTNFNFVFNTDGTLTISGSYRETTTLTTISEPDPVVEQEIVVVEEETISYSANDENDTITADGDTYEVTRFTATELRLEFNEVEVFGDETTTISQEIRLGRQN